MLIKEKFAIIFANNLPKEDSVYSTPGVSYFLFFYRPSVWNNMCYMLFFLGTFGALFNKIADLSLLRPVSEVLRYFDNPRFFQIKFPTNIYFLIIKTRTKTPEFFYFMFARFFFKNTNSGDLCPGLNCHYTAAMMNR